MVSQPQTYPVKRDSKGNDSITACFIGKLWVLSKLVKALSLANIA